MRTSIRLFFIVLLTINFFSCRKSTVKGVVKITKKVENLKTAKNLLKSKKVLKNKKLWAQKNNLELVSKKSSKSAEIIGKKGVVLGTISEIGSNRVITTYSLTSKKAVNPLLDKPALPNTIYKIENQIFKTDHLGRTVDASVDVIPKSVVNRNSISRRYEQLKSQRKGGLAGVHHGGHIIGHSIGGNSGLINIVPQTAKLNMGPYSSIESFVTNNRSFIKNYSVKVYYKGDSHVPERFVQSFNFFGDENLLKALKLRHTNFNYLAETDGVGKKFKRVVVLHSNGHN